MSLSCIYKSKTDDFSDKDRPILRMQSSIFKQKPDMKSDKRCVEIILKDTSVISIDPAKIIVIKIWEDGHDKGTSITTKDNVYNIEPMMHFECIELFGPKIFFICNREYLVNRYYVFKADYDKRFLILSNDMIIPFDRRKIKVIKRMLRGAE